MGYFEQSNEQTCRLYVYHIEYNIYAHTHTAINHKCMNPKDLSVSWQRHNL